MMAGATAKKCQGRGAGKPFKPGHDPRRNTNGRPKGAKSLSDELRRLWDMPCNEAAPILARLGFPDFPADHELTVGQVLAWKCVGRAVEGSVPDFREIHDRLDPRPNKSEIKVQTETLMPSISTAIQQVLQAAPGQVSLTELPADVDISRVGGMPEIRKPDEAGE